MIYQYRRFGPYPGCATRSCVLVRVLPLCYFLVLLPLKTARLSFMRTPARAVQLVHGSWPKRRSRRAIRPPTAALRDPYVYEAFFNVLLLVPLGMYLRYYFRRTWWQTLAIGFLGDAVVRDDQLTGSGAHEHPPPVHVDDHAEHAGAMIGFWTVGPAMRVLPDIRLVNEARGHAPA